VKTDPSQPMTLLLLSGSILLINDDRYSSLVKVGIVNSRGFSDVQIKFQELLCLGWHTQPIRAAGAKNGMRR
jgi:hypothetical protein